MATLNTELGMKIEMTPLASAVEELDQLLIEKADILDKIAQQRAKVCALMKEKRQYQVRCGNFVYEYKLKEEEETVAKKKI